MPPAFRSSRRAGSRAMRRTIQRRCSRSPERSRLGSPELLAGPEWESTGFRLANQDVIRLVASEILRSRPRGRVLAEARRLDVPMVPVNSPDEFVAEEQTRGRGIFRQTDFPHLA